MLDALDMVCIAVDESILIDLPVLPVANGWCLVVESKKQYKRKYVSCDKGLKGSKKKCSPRRRTRLYNGKSCTSGSRVGAYSVLPDNNSGFSGDNTNVEYY